MKISSTAFKEGGKIPAVYTCEGLNENPPIQISDVPKNAKSLALIVEDPDATNGTFTHWVLFDLPPTTKELMHGSPHTTNVLGITGVNDAGTNEYTGPCPPTGVHRYIFTLYALDTMLRLPVGTNKRAVMGAMAGHVLEESKMSGVFGRA